jgi:hypothetical protein
MKMSRLAGHIYEFYLVNLRCCIRSTTRKVEANIRVFLTNPASQLALFVREKSVKTNLVTLPRKLTSNGCSSQILKLRRFTVYTTQQSFHNQLGVGAGRARRRARCESRWRVPN